MHYCRLVRLGKQTSILKLILELLQSSFYGYFNPVSEFFEAAMMSSPDQIKETPEGRWEGVGLGSPEESNVGPGLAHVIEGGQGII